MTPCPNDIAILAILARACALTEAGLVPDAVYETDIMSPDTLGSVASAYYSNLKIIYPRWAPKLSFRARDRRPASAGAFFKIAGQKVAAC